MNTQTTSLESIEPNTKATMQVRIKSYRKSTHYQMRRAIHYLAMLLAFAAMGFGIFWLGWILYTLVANGIQGLNLSIFTELTPPPEQAGGLKNAILGTLMMSAVGTMIGTPIGMMAGIYLSEFGQKNALASTTRFINDILLSAPSIIIGLFVYEVYVIRVGNFSGWAGAFALALLVIPVVVRTTENMLRLVPASLREAAVALGAPQWKVILQITLRAAKSGILTGVLLAIARISGETAPLLFTSMNHQFMSNMNEPMASLPMVIAQFAMTPYEGWQQLAWTGALLITLMVLSINIIGRYLGRNRI